MSDIAKEDQMKLRKQAYKEANKQTLCIYNLSNTVISIALGITTVILLQNEEKAVCDGVNIRICLWLIAAMHVINAAEAVLDFTGLDNIFCCCCCVIGFFFYEVGVIIYMNIILWNAAACRKESPELYWWLFTNVFVFYFSFGIWVFFLFKAWFGSPDEPEKQ